MREDVDPTWRGAVLAVRVALGLAGALALAPVVASLVLRQMVVTRPRLVAYVAGTPVVALAGAVAIVLFLLARSRIGTAVASVLTAVLVLSQVPLYLGTASAAPGSTPLVVMTLNMHFGGADPAGVVGEVRRHHVDVLATEEMTPQAVDALRAAGISDVLPYQDLKPGGGAAGNGVWSRYRLTHVHTPFDFGHPPDSTTLDYHGRAIFMSAVHPVSPYPSNSVEWSEEMGRWRRGCATSTGWPSSPATSTPLATTSSSGTSSTPGSVTPPPRPASGGSRRFPPTGAASRCSSPSTTCSWAAASWRPRSTA